MENKEYKYLKVSPITHTIVKMLAASKRISVIKFLHGLFLNEADKAGIKIPNVPDISEK